MKKQQVAVYLYKCRRCGKIDKSTESAVISAHTRLLEATMNQQILENGPRLHLTETHICNEGGMGITDLIGYEVLET